MKTETTDTLIWIFCIIVLLGLSVKISIQADTFDCDQCTVVLKDARVQEGYIDAGTYQIKNLFEAYMNGTCLLYWDPVQGYGGGSKQW